MKQQKIVSLIDIIYIELSKLHIGNNRQ